MDYASDLGANGLKEGSSSQPTIAKASIVDNFVSIKNYMDSNNSCEANEANKQTPYEWTEDFESDDEVDEVLYHKEISLKINLISSLKVEFGIFCMHTWNSERTSPFAFDVEIEKTARQNRVLHQATLASSSVRIDLEGAPLDNFESENFEKSFESDVEVEEVEIVNMAKGIDTYFRSGSFEDPSPVVGQLANERSTRPTPIPTEGVVEDYVSDEEEDPMTVEMNDKIILKETKESFQNDFKAPKQLKLGKGVNIPLIDAIKQIPAYAKFLKDMYALKRCHKKVDSIAHVSIALINSLPLKYKDPGAPLISIEIVYPNAYPMNELDHTLENLLCVGSEKELFDGMTFQEREEEF
ncbi:hypothetical protein Tco_0333510 [Tanacetum coccineum]